MKSVWNMTVPVLSTAHMPETDTPTVLGMLYARYDDGYFVWVSDDPDSEWEARIRDWMYANYPGEGNNWVRFDSCGDTVDDLPNYSWDKPGTQSKLDIAVRALAEIATTKEPDSNDDEHDLLNDRVAIAQGALRRMGDLK